MPSLARDAFVRHAEISGDRPATATDLFDRLRDWATDADLAEARGGYPGGRGRPGWTDYVKLQQKHLTVYRALVGVFGSPSLAVAELFGSYARKFTAPSRRMGDGYEPHVDDLAGRLIYSLPVDSGFVSLVFEFPISERDLGVLLHDPWRRALLEVTAHTVLQRSMMRGNPEVTGLEFSSMVDAVLHSTPDRLVAFVHHLSQEHHIDVEHYARHALERRTPSGEGVRSERPTDSGAMPEAADER